jgi:hypothetical protein
MSVLRAKGTATKPISTPNPQQVRMIRGGGTESSFFVRSGDLANVENEIVISVIKSPNICDDFILMFIVVEF